jgi:tetratricopeptide (TPR) repeat protein
MLGTAGAALALTSPQKAPPKPSTPQTTTADPVSAHMSAGADALAAKNYARAASEFQAAVSLAPGNQQAQFWTGQALLYGGESRQAIPYLEASRKLGLDSVGLHLALVEAYANADDHKQRDAERDLLVSWHSDGKHPSLERAQGFRVEVMTAGSHHINALEYFEPTGERHDRYRFTVRDSAQIIDALYVLDSADDYQADFARLHPQEAAEGKRRFALVKYVGLNPEEARPVVYKYYNTEPGYEDVRSDVLRAVKVLPQVKVNKP